jgi:hypothetical protein
MLGKAEKVKEICDIEYFTDEDIESIRMLDKDKLEFVWGVIRWHVDGFLIKGLKSCTCPFCIYYRVNSIMTFFRSDCGKCPYGRLHGICGNDDSDYKKIVRSKNFSIAMFADEFYKGLIQDIDGHQEVS